MRIWCRKRQTEQWKWLCTREIDPRTYLTTYYIIQLEFQAMGKIIKSINCVWMSWGGMLEF